MYVQLFPQKIEYLEPSSKRKPQYYEYKYV